MCDLWVQTRSCGQFQRKRLENAVGTGGGGAPLPSEPKHLLVLFPVHRGPHEAEGPAAQQAQRAVLVRVCTLAGRQPVQLPSFGGLLKPWLASECLQTRGKSRGPHATDRRRHASPRPPTMPHGCGKSSTCTLWLLLPGGLETQSKLVHASKRVYTPPCMWGTHRFKTPHGASTYTGREETMIQSHKQTLFPPPGERGAAGRTPHTERPSTLQVPTSPTLGPGSSHTEWPVLGRLARSRRVRGPGAGAPCRSLTSQQQKRGAGPWSSTRFTSKCTPVGEGRSTAPG